MAVHSGTQGSVVYNSSNGTIGTLVGGMKSWTVTVEAEELDTSSFGQDWRNFDAGIKQWGGTFQGNKEGAGTIQNLVWTNLLAGTKAEATLYAGTIDRYYGTVIILGEEITQTFDNFAETSYNFRGDGILGKGTA